MCQGFKQEVKTGQIALFLQFIQVTIKRKLKIVIPSFLAGPLKRLYIIVGLELYYEFNLP